MFLEHFKLSVQPFGVTPDPRFLYLGQTHREALASLLHGIRSGRGFTALIAAPGMGKTTLLFNLLHSLEDDTKTAFLFQTLCGPGEFINALVADLGINDDGKNITRMQAKLNEYLLRESYFGRQVVVIIDEAQNLDEQVLEVVRMLSNFETPNKKLLHVVLAGQPLLAEKLSSGSLTQLRQRISIVARLAPLNGDEIRAYIEHRLRVAGAASEKPLFSDKAYAMIAEQSGGIPRNINNLCFNSMSLACALQRPRVDALMVQETINDLDLRAIPSPKPREVRRQSRPTAFARALALGILAFLVWFSVRVLRSNDGMPLQSGGSLSQERTGADSKISSLSRSPQQLHSVEHSLNIGSLLDEERLDAAQAAPKKDHVPFEPAPQREKR